MPPRWALCTVLRRSSAERCHYEATGCLGYTCHIMERPFFMLTFSISFSMLPATTVYLSCPHNQLVIYVVNKKKHYINHLMERALAAASNHTKALILLKEQKEILLLSNFPNSSRLL